VLAQDGGPTSGPTPAPTGATPVPGPSATPGGPTLSTEGSSITDTEYLSIPIDAAGKPNGPASLKDWLRVRGRAGTEVPVRDPVAFEDVKTLSGSESPRRGEGALEWLVELPEEQFEDLYYQGDVATNAQGLFMTADGPKALPVKLDIAYYTGAPGSETRVTPQVFASQRGPAKMVFTVQNTTEAMEELTYNDVQTKKDVTAVAPVWTPYVVKIGPILFPDEQFDQIQTDGSATRVGNATEVTWTLSLSPPDYPAKQTAIAQFLIAKPELPAIRVTAQPQYPPAKAEALTSEGIQFQGGRRSFLYDVFDLLRSNLISLTGLFGLLDDAFSNLALPLIAPEKGNREAGSFEDPNQLWALWTLAKGMEQLNRAVDVLDYSLQLARNGLKGEIGTVSQMRHLLGRSTDPAAADIGAIANLPPAQLTALVDALTGGDPALAAGPIENIINKVVGGSIWQNIKDLEFTLGCTDCGTDPNRELPEAPISVTPDNPVAGIVISVIRLKLALFEQNLACLQKEDHSNQCATFSGVSNTAESTEANDWRKFTTITFPFGQEEIADGLYNLKVNGVDLVQAALGNKDQPNSIIWAMHVLTDGMESLSDSFHQLGSTWRYLADSLQNFGIFGVETAKNTLQLDINNLDLASAQRAAAGRRLGQAFMGAPEPTKKVPVNTQFVLVYSTDPEEAPVAGALDTARGKFVVALAFAFLILMLIGFARFRWYLL
ncbi:MAG: hypothetical protein LC722_08780, partial [Actinobacteria bacterium]|nr:hypothetical protein [Actinomycetota bacterium]